MVLKDIQLNVKNNGRVGDCQVIFTPFSYRTSFDSVWDTMQGDRKRPSMILRKVEVSPTLTWFMWYYQSQNPIPWFWEEVGDPVVPLTWPKNWIGDRESSSWPKKQLTSQGVCSQVGNVTGLEHLLPELFLTLLIYCVFNGRKRV